MTLPLRCRGLGLSVLVFVALSACPPPTPALRPVDTTTVKQVVGAAGGSLVHPTGAKLVVPPGALSADVELSLTGAAAPDPAQTGAPAVGQAFVLGPEGQTFATPLSIEVPVDPALVQQRGAGVDELRLRLAPQSTMQFVELATTADTERKVLTAQLTHFSIIVPVVSGSGFTFSTSGLPAASVGVAYSGALVVSGGTAPYAFSVVAGSLPPGLSVNAAGVFSGTPTAAGNFVFTVRVTDSAANAAEAVVVMAVGGQGQCNAVPNSGGLVAEQRVAAAAPAPAGGTVALGTWVRASAIIYTGIGGATGPTGRQVRQALRLTMVNGSLRFDSVYQEPGEAIELVSGSAAFNGTQLTVTFNCPQPGTRAFTYSATAGRFTLFEPVTGGLREMVFVPEGTSLPTDGGTLLDGGSPTDAGTVTDAGTASDAGTLACSGPGSAGAVVLEQYAAGLSPQATGGVVPDGDYALVSQLVYDADAGTSGPTGVQRAQTLRITGTQVAATTDDGPGPQTTQYALAYAGPTVVLTQTCPAGSATQNFAYSMLSGPQLRLMRGSSRGTVVSLYQLTGASDGGVASDAGVAPDAGAVVDAGVEVIGTGFTDLVDLAREPSTGFLYTLGGGEVRRCDTVACGGTGNGTLVTNAFASSLTVDNGTLYLTTDFQNVKRCDVTNCTLTTFAAPGANTYPAHLVVANGYLYWMAEAGPSRRIQACPLSGCGAGPTGVYTGAELDGVPVSGVAVDASAVYVASFTGGLWRIPLSGPDTASGPAVNLSGSAYGTGGLVVDGTTLAWAESNDNRVRACSLPSCASTFTVRGGLVTPTGLAFDSTWVYGVDRGTPNGSGGFVAGTGRVWRFRK